MKEDLSPPPFYYSVITGIFIFPIFIILINRLGESNVLSQFILSIVLLFSVYISVRNKKYLAYLKKKGVPLFLRGASWSNENMEYLFVPAWKRIIVILLCTIISVVILIFLII